MRATIILSLICLFCFAVPAQAPPLKFADYPARIIQAKSSVKVKLNSTPDTSCFRTMLWRTARQGVRFAGHYAIDYWGCGTNCARIGIVDTFAPTSGHGTPPDLLRCELAAAGYREISFDRLTGSEAYLAIFAPPPLASRPRPDAMVACKAR